MAGKSGKRVTGNKPESSNRTSAKTDGVFGKENIAQTGSEPVRNRDKATVKSDKKTSDK